MVPETRYARKGDAHIAYQVLGDGDLDLVLVSAWFSHLEARWEIPGFVHYLRRLSAFSRLISFDKHGIGLSDPLPLDKLPPLEEWMDDVRAVMDAVGSEQAAVMGANEASMMAAMFAASHPERVTGLVLAGGTAGLRWSPDHPTGARPEVVDRLVGLVEESWGQGELMAVLSPSLAGDSAALQAWGRFMRLSASPAVAAAVFRMIFSLDVRDVLPAISAPTLVVNRQANPLISPSSGREVAERIPNATFVEVPGDDYGLAVGDIDSMIDVIEEFLTGSRPSHEPDRVLATVLFTDIVSSTERAAELGDRRWKELLEDHHRLVRSELERARGKEVRIAGDGFLATFDGPARAIRCACAIRDAVRGLGLEIRAGLHTGEIELAETGIEGIAVHVGARIADLAVPGEVLASSTVRDLVAGSGIEFVDRGVQVLRGVPGEWRIQAVTDAG